MSNRFLKILIIATLLLSPLWLIRTANAQVASSVHINQSQVVSGNLYTSGQNVTIDGPISGDLIVAAQNLTVNSSVGGDIIAIASTITINGSVDGNIRVVGGTVILNNSITRNLNVLADNITLGPNSHVGWDAYLKSNNLLSQGSIDGNLNAWASDIALSGKIGHDAKLNLADDKGPTSLNINSTAVIGRNLTYDSQKTANISQQATIKGQIEQNSAKQISHFNFIWLWKKILAIFSSLVVGLALIYLFKKTTPEIINQITIDPIKTLWFGLIVSLLTPLLAIILAFTLIGLPLSLIIIAAWMTAIFLAKILTAIWVGRLIINLFNKKNKQPLLWPLILGVVVCWLLFALPWIGWIISLLAVWFGLGNIWKYVKNRSKSF